MERAATKPGNSINGIEGTFKAYDHELNCFLLRRLRGQVHSSEDIRQEIYLRMLRFADMDLVREPRAYLYRVARNVLRDRLLLSERERLAFDAWAEEGIAEDPTIRIDNARYLEQILRQLPAQHRAVLQLRTTQGLSYSEIAQALELSVHTVKKYMHSALVQCRSISLSMK